MTLWDKILLVGGIGLGYGAIIALVAAFAYVVARAWLWASRDDKKGR